MSTTCSAFPYTCKSDMPHSLSHYVTRLTRHVTEHELGLIFIIQRCFVVVGWLFFSLTQV